MEHQKILTSLNEANDSKLMTRKWNIFSDNSKVNYDAANEIAYNKEVLKSTVCDYNHAYILVIANITTAGNNLATQAAFKNCAPFTKCITKIDETTIDDAENLDLVISMYNTIQYSSNYSKTTGSCSFYYKDEAANFNAYIANTNDFKSLKYESKLLENTEVDGADGILKNVTIAVPLKYLSNFWISLEMPLIIWKVELKLKWSKCCDLSPADADNVSSNANDNNITFTIKNTKLYVPEVTLLARDH